MELMTASEVADFLKVAKGTVYQLKAMHKIPFIKIGGVVRFNKADIEQWLQNKIEGGKNE